MGKFIMRRKGEFELTSDSHNQCKEGGHRKFKYKVKLEAQNRLDSDGFIVDHEVIDQMIQSEIKNADSCENIAKTITYGLIDLLSEEGVEIINLSVRVIPKGNNVKANIEFIV